MRDVHVSAEARIESLKQTSNIRRSGSRNIVQDGLQLNSHDRTAVKVDVASTCCQQVRCDMRNGHGNGASSSQLVKCSIGNVRNETVPLHLMVCVPNHLPLPEFEKLQNRNFQVLPIAST